jgi:TfoX/Sxy family transcriptional regulator of competence genes
MPSDEGLVQRIRELLEGDPRISEKRMFGGIAFFADGGMAAGIIDDELMVRVGPRRFEEALARPHARAMDFTGRRMRGFVQVRPEGFEDDADLQLWIGLGIAYAVEVQAEAGEKKASARRSR